MSIAKTTRPYLLTRETAAARIEQLEAALREISEGDLDVVLSMRQIARAALAQSSPPAMWCPGCSQEVSHACHLFNCPVGEHRMRLDSVEEIAKALLMEGRITPNTARALMASAQSPPDGK